MMMMKRLPGCLPDDAADTAGQLAMIKMSAPRGVAQIFFKSNIEQLKLILCNDAGGDRKWPNE